MSSTQINIKKRNGKLEKLNINKINQRAEIACDGLEETSASEIVLDAHVQFYDKIATQEIDKALIMSARQKIEKEPNYAYVAGRLLISNIHKEVFGESHDKDIFEAQYKNAFVRNIKKLIKFGTLREELLDFDLKALSEAIDPDRDLKFKYLGAQIIYDRYLLHIEGKRLETPQGVWMRVAMGLAINEKD